MKLFRNLSLFLLSILSLPVVFAGPFDAIERVAEFVFKIGGFTWVVDKVPATKFAIFIIIFSVLHLVLTTGVSVGGKERKGIFGNEGQGRKVSIIISFCMAAITVIFIPNDVAQGFGKMYSMIFSLVLVGLPVGALILVAWKFASKQKPAVKHLVRLFCALIAMFVVATVARQYGVGLDVSFILPLIFLEVKDE